MSSALTGTFNCRASDMKQQSWRACRGTKVGIFKCINSFQKSRYVQSLHAVAIGLPLVQAAASNSPFVKSCGLGQVLGPSDSDANFNERLSHRILRTCHALVTQEV